MSQPSLLPANVQIPSAALADDPMIAAVRSGSLADVRALVTAGASVNAPDTRGATPLQHAIDTGRKDVEEYLREHGAEDSATVVRRIMAQYLSPKAGATGSQAVSDPRATGLPSAHTDYTTQTPATALSAGSELANGNIARTVRRGASFVSPPPEIYLNRTVVSTPSGELSLEDLFHEVDSNGDRRISAMHELPVALTIMGLHWDEALGVALLADRTGVDTLEEALGERCEEWWGSGAAAGTSTVAAATAYPPPAPPAPPPKPQVAPLTSSLSLQDAIDIDSDVDSADSDGSSVVAPSLPDTSRSTTGFARPDAVAGTAVARAPPPPPPRKSFSTSHSLDTLPGTGTSSDAPPSGTHSHRRSSTAGPMEDRLIDWTTFCSIVALLQAASAYKEVIRKLLRERSERARLEAEFAAAAASARAASNGPRAVLPPPAPPRNAGIATSPSVRATTAVAADAAGSRTRSRSDAEQRGPPTAKATIVPPLLPLRASAGPRQRLHSTPEDADDGDRDEGDTLGTARSVDVGALGRRQTAGSRKRATAGSSGQRRSPAGAALRRAQTENQQAGSIALEASQAAAGPAKDKKTLAIERMTTLLKGRGTVMTGISSLAVGTRVPIGSTGTSSAMPRRTPTSQGTSFFAVFGDSPSASSSKPGATSPSIGGVRLKRRSSNDAMLRGSFTRVTEDGQSGPSDAFPVTAQASPPHKSAAPPPAVAARRRRVTASIETGLAAPIAALYAGPASAPARQSDSFIMPRVSPLSPAGGAVGHASAVGPVSSQHAGAHRALPPTSPSATRGALFRRESLRRVVVSPRTAEGADTGSAPAVSTQSGSRSASAAELAQRQAGRFSFDSSRSSPSAAGPFSARTADDAAAAGETDGRAASGVPPSPHAYTSSDASVGCSPENTGASPSREQHVSDHGTPAGAAISENGGVTTSGDTCVPGSDVTTHTESDTSTDDTPQLVARTSAGQMSSISEAPDGSQNSDSGDDILVPVPPHEVFLGGACNPTIWRRNTAMPFLESSGITYYNPQVDDWRPELVVQEAKAKDEADVVFFVVGPETRAVASMIEVAELISSGRPVVLVLQDVPKDAVMNGHTLHADEIKDLNRGRAYLANVADRHGVTVYQSIEAALREVVVLIATKREDRRNMMLAARSARRVPSDAVLLPSDDDDDSDCDNRTPTLEMTAELGGPLSSAVTNARSSIFTSVSDVTPTE